MPSYVILEAAEWELERFADSLLRQAGEDPERPAYSESQLRRRSRRQISIAELSETLTAMPQEMEGELRFLVSVCRLNPETRRFLHLWIEGWTQEEIAGAFGISQQAVSARLKRGLRVCYDAAPLAFRRFCHHTIYHRPAHARPEGTRCPRCGRLYPSPTGVCSICEDEELKALCSSPRRIPSPGAGRPDPEESTGRNQVST